MQKRVRNDEAVSPVIGVILMVAITVILAAVIAAFVFGMAGTTQKTKNIAATAQVVGSNTTVTYQGGPDNSLLVSGTAGDYPLVATFTKADGSAITTNVVAFNTQTVNVGDSATAPHTTGAKDHIVVVANFTDGQRQVILDTMV